MNRINNVCTRWLNRKASDTAHKTISRMQCKSTCRSLSQYGRKIPLLMPVIIGFAAAIVSLVNKLMLVEPVTRM
jgi:hypothetical protein